MPSTLSGSDAALNRSVGPLPAEHAAALARSWTSAEAAAYCARVTHGHYENFPVGSFLIPKALRPAVQSLYAFMRTADDFADEDRRSGDEAERLAWLVSWETLLERCVDGRPSHPIFIALHETLREHDLPVQWLRDLLTAFKQDVSIRRYATYNDVLTYCRYSANPVGRLILTLFGYRDEALYAQSDAICTGLQLANHWQDIAVDLAKDRIYVPQDDQRRFGVGEADLRRGSVAAAVRDLIAFEVDRARALFRQGRGLPENVSGRLRVELRLTWLGGMRVLEKIQAVDYDVFRARPVVEKSDWARLALRALVGGPL